METEIRELFARKMFSEISNRLAGNPFFPEDGIDDTHFFYFLARAEVFLEQHNSGQALVWIEKASNIRPNDPLIQEIRTRAQLARPPEPARESYVRPTKPKPPSGTYPRHIPDITDPDVDS